MAKILLIVGGGSNLVVADAGFDGTVLEVATRGIEVEGDTCGGAFVTVQAGEVWDVLVDRAVAEGWVGIEAMTGIPGKVGATPIQNVGAYGQEVAQTVELVRVWDRRERRVRDFAPADLAFSYRDSALKRSTVAGSPRHVVLAVRFRLERGTESAPVRYGELARRLGVQVGERAPLERVRETVLALRAGKGMVLDPEDRDTMDLTQWLTRLGAELGTDDLPLDDAAVTDLLDLTREAAHGVERIAGPLTTFLVGVAVGRGADVAVATEAALALLEEPTPDQAATEQGAG